MSNWRLPNDARLVLYIFYLVWQSSQARIYSSYVYIRCTVSSLPLLNEATRKKRRRRRKVTRFSSPLRTEARRRRRNFLRHFYLSMRSFKQTPNLAKSCGSHIAFVVCGPLVLVIELAAGPKQTRSWSSWDRSLFFSSFYYSLYIYMPSSLSAVVQHHGREGGALCKPPSRDDDE